MEILTQHEMAPNTFYKSLNIPLKINVPCMESDRKRCCCEINLNSESLSNCNFLNEIFYFVLLFMALESKMAVPPHPHIPTEVIWPLFYIMKSLEFFIFV